MLAPNDIGPILSTFKACFFDICSVQKAHCLISSLHVIPYANSHAWVSDFKARAGFLNKTGKGWNEKKPAIVSGIANSFSNYSTIFAVVQNMLAKIHRGDVAVSLLDRLLTQIDENITETGKVNAAFNDYIADIKLGINPIEESISRAWNDLGNSEAEMLALASQIALVQNEVEALDSSMSLSSLDSFTVSNLSSVVSGIVSINYAMIVSGLTVPYLSVGFLVFSMSKTIYDIFVNAARFEKAISTLSDYKSKLSLEQKALAQTKALIGALYSIKEVLNTCGNSMNGFVAFWKNEKQNVLTIRSAFNQADTYNPQNAEVLQLPVAETVWNTMAFTSKDFMACISKIGDTTNRKNINILV